jgi:hypothetical protein
MRDPIAAPELSEAEAGRLIATYIRQDPVRPGRHEALVEAGAASVPVWRLIRYAGAAGSAEVARLYNLPDEAMAAALAYYRRHRELLDAKLLLEDEADAAVDERLATGRLPGWRPARAEAASSPADADESPAR